MDISVIAFTREGGSLASTICNQLIQGGCHVTGYVFAKYEREGLTSFAKLQPLIASLFQTQDAIVFASATGIAVRAIASHLKSKTTDPAVLVVDEAGTFVISLVSGHIGGANELTRVLANGIHAVPVITTATDVRQKVAIDSWAVKRNLSIQELNLAKEVAASLLEEQEVGYVCELEGDVFEIPQGFVRDTTVELGVYVGDDKTKQPFPKTLHLLTRPYVLGIGCRKDTPFATIDQVVEEVLVEYGIEKERIGLISSIDLKKEEQGLHELKNKWKVPFETFTARELNQVTGEFTASEFVKKTTGVDNVCERSAVLGSERGDLIIKKIGKNGVTVAIAKRRMI